MLKEMVARDRIERIIAVRKGPGIDACRLEVRHDDPMARQEGGKGPLSPADVENSQAVSGQRVDPVSHRLESLVQLDIQDAGIAAKLDEAGGLLAPPTLLLRLPLGQ